MQARAPDEGPSCVQPSASETSSQLASQDVEIEERRNPMHLRAVVEKHNINSTKSLVAAYNKTTDEDERALLIGWLRKYHQRREDCLKQKAVLEYSELVNITPRSLSEEDILKNLIRDLCSSIPVGNFLPPDFAAALHRALVRVDPSVYGVAELMVVARKLLESLSPTPKLERENFLVYRGTFLTLQQIFFLFLKSNQGGIGKEAKHEFRQVIAAKERFLRRSCEYYPVKFRFQVLCQAVEHLEARDTSRIAEVFLITGGFCGSAHVLHSLLMLACIDVCPEAVQRAFRKARAAVEDMGVLKRPWFDSFQNLMAARLEAAKDETKLDIFGSVCSTAIESQRRMKNGEELKALRFGIIDELGMLAVEGSSENARREATIRLSNLATQQAISEGWIGDDDILMALLDGIYKVHKTGQCNETTKETLIALHQSCEGSTRDALMEWLDGNSIEEKLRAGSPLAATLEHKDLFIKTRRDVGYTPPTGEDLRKAYLHDNFATVMSRENELPVVTVYSLKVACLLDEGSPKHVKDMKHHVVMYDEIIGERGTRSRDRPQGVIQKEGEGEGESFNRRSDKVKEYHEKKAGVTKSIALEDLFKRRSFKRGDLESEVRKVLLYGNPGSGKTCITKVVAHKWALGEMAQDFDAVYVVPVSLLNSGEHNGQKWTRLEEAIFQICFSGGTRTFDYENLVAQVYCDLDDSSTLLMLDGLDAANDYAMELLATVWERSCKVWFLSRPYNTRDVKTRVDVLVECLGFDDQQLRDYIKVEMSEDEAPRLIRFIEDSDVLWEMAHVPVTANLLCCLSKKHGTATEDQGKRASLFQIYNDMSNFVWKRFEEKPTAKNVQKVEIFEDLEELAFETLREGLVLIDETFVVQHATSKEAAQTFEESGLLLPVSEDQGYRFQHLTFQEYFAGRHIAKNLQRKGLDGERVVAFIREEKYNEKHAATLSFATHAFAEGRGKDALQEMLSIVDEEPVEILGIQHFFLKMRVLNATLEETREDDLKELLQDKRATKLAESARLLLERTIDDAEIRRIIVQEFQQLSRVMEEFPQILTETIEEVKKTLVCVHNWTREERVKVTDLLKLRDHNAKQSDRIVQFVLQKVDEPDGWCNPKECIRRLSSIAEKLPHHARMFLQKLVTFCGNGDFDVRQAAIEAIGRIVAAAPHHAGDAQLTLAEKCRDEHWNVRQEAIVAISCVVVAAPQHSGKFLPALEEGCSDENGDVCQAALAVIGSVVEAAPQHASEVLTILAKRCDDKDWDIRRASIEAIGRTVAAAPHHSGEVLAILVKGYGHRHWKVRQAALSAIGSVVVAAPTHADEVLPTLAEGCGDGDPYVRRSSIEAIGRSVAAAPHHASEFLMTLAQGCGDEDPSVRHAAMSSIGSVIATTPTHADELLPMIAEGCGDGDPSVRHAAMTAIGSAVATAPTHADEFLMTLAQGCGDGDPSVRHAAMTAIGSAVATAPTHADEFLPTLAKWCGNGHPSVRRAAMSAIGSVVAAAPQHAGKYLPTLAKGCGAEDYDECQAAMSAIGSVLAAVPQRAGEFLPTLAKGCGNGHSSVRRTAISAIGSVVAAVPQRAAEFLPTLAKGCGDGNPSVRYAAMSAIGSVLAVAPQHAGEFLPKLAEGCGDKKYHVCQAAMSAIGSVVSAAPQHASEFLPSLAKVCGHRDYDERQTAMSAIGSVLAAAAPQHADEFLPTLAKGCGDRHWHVRRAAMTAIGSVLAVAPQHAGDFLPSLATWCSDEEWRVRRAAMTAIGSVLSAAPQHAAEFLPILAGGCGDGYPSVRHAAMSAIGSVVAAAPQHAGEYHPTLAEGCSDGDSAVRDAAMLAIGSVIAAAPQHAAEFLQTLANRCGDGNPSVRRAAILAIGSVVAAAPQHAAEFLPTLAGGCADGYPSVRHAAVLAIGNVVAAAPQHAGDFQPMLDEGCCDDDPSVRRSAISAIGIVVAAAPQHVGEFLPLLAKGCSDLYFSVRRAAISAIGSVVANTSHILTALFQLLKTGYEDKDFFVRQNAIENVGKALRERQFSDRQLLPILESGCNDKDFFVRQTAIEAVCEAIIVEPNLSGGLLKLLDEECIDKVYFVRWSAMEAMGKALEATSHLTDRGLSILEKGHRDEDFFVRLKAIEAVGSAVEAAPELAGELMPILQRGCEDEHSDVRANALKALEAVPQFICKLVSMLERGCVDEDNDARSNALRATGAVVKTALDLSSKLLPMLQTQCNDEQSYSGRRSEGAVSSESGLDWITPLSSITALKNKFLLIFVQNSFTLNPTTEDEKVSLALHASSSHEIGNWEGEALNKHLEQLTEDFEEKFPGLLENLVMHE